VSYCIAALIVPVFFELMAAIARLRLDRAGRPRCK
jgi:hypothetical protein